MKKLLLLLLCLSLFSLAACDDKEEPATLATVGESRELLPGNRDGKTTSQEITGFGKPDRTEKEPISEIENNIGKIEFESPVITIPDPSPVTPPISAESTEEPTVKD